MVDFEQLNVSWVITWKLDTMTTLLRETKKKLFNGLKCKEPQWQILREKSQNHIFQTKVLKSNSLIPAGENVTNVQEFANIMNKDLKKSCNKSESKTKFNKQLWYIKSFFSQCTLFLPPKNIRKPFSGGRERVYWEKLG